MSDTSARESGCTGTFKRIHSSVMIIEGPIHSGKRRPSAGDIQSLLYCILFTSSYVLLRCHHSRFTHNQKDDGANILATISFSVTFSADEAVFRVSRARFTCSGHRQVLPIGNRKTQKAQRIRFRWCKLIQLGIDGDLAVKRLD